MNRFTIRIVVWTLSACGACSGLAQGLTEEPSSVEPSYMERWPLLEEPILRITGQAIPVAIAEAQGLLDPGDAGPAQEAITTEPEQLERHSLLLQNFEMNLYKARFPPRPWDQEEVIEPGSETSFMPPLKPGSPYRGTVTIEGRVYDMRDITTTYEPSALRLPDSDGSMRLEGQKLEVESGDGSELTPVVRGEFPLDGLKEISATLAPAWRLADPEPASSGQSEGSEGLVGSDPVLHRSYIRLQFQPSIGWTTSVTGEAETPEWRTYWIQGRVESILKQVLWRQDGDQGLTIVPGDESFTLQEDRKLQVQ